MTTSLFFGSDSERIGVKPFSGLDGYDLSVLATSDWGVADRALQVAERYGHADTVAAIGAAAFMGDTFREELAKAHLTGQPRLSGIDLTNAATRAYGRVTCTSPHDLLTYYRSLRTSVQDHRHLGLEDAILKAHNSRSGDNLAAATMGAFMGFRVPQLERVTIPDDEFRGYQAAFDLGRNLASELAAQQAGQ